MTDLNVSALHDAIREAEARNGNNGNVISTHGYHGKKWDHGLELTPSCPKQQIVPPKQLLMYLVRMGSFTSKSAIPPTWDSDLDSLGLETITNSETLLQLCSEQLRNMPEPFKRSWVSRKKTRPSQGSTLRTSSADLTKDHKLIRKTNSRSLSFETCIHNENGCRTDEEGTSANDENIRIFQWNALSQTLGTKNDNFVRCPQSALDWKTRRFRMLEEIALSEADVICLQEVDHFDFFQRALAPLNYQGHFVPKPDSPCIYLPENSGPDGCAIFFKTDKFELEKLESRIIEVWRVQSNQVVLSAVLKSKSSGEEVMVATTHLKARSGSLLSTLRNEQGKDILAFLARQQGNSDRPIIISGDFNAEPTEPVYHTMTEGISDNVMSNSEKGPLKFKSAYAETTPDGSETPYTTWKIREDGEHIQTLDYVFYTDDHTDDDTSRVAPRLQVESVLDFPSGQDIGPDRLPSERYASDHFSLVVDFKMTSSFGKHQSKRSHHNATQSRK